MKYKGRSAMTAHVESEALLLQGAPRRSLAILSDVVGSARDCDIPVGPRANHLHVIVVEPVIRIGVWPHRMMRAIDAVTRFRPALLDDIQRCAHFNPLFFRFPDDLSGKVASLL